MTKWSAALVCLAWLGACTFPDFEVSSAPRCDDGVRNGDETGIDCGMLACSVACPAGQGCDDAADCVDGVCGENRICRAATCEDDVQNGDESDIDCGGEQGCERCAVGERCGSATDCDGGACTNGQCRAATCQDNLKNGLETDVDCGGGECDPCDVGQSCQAPGDCDGVACTRRVCQPPSCSDQILNQDETDLDCGGGCDPCADGKTCKVGDDCLSRVCPTKTKQCANPSCTDGVHNGTETDVDCGGACPKKCQEIQGCAVPDDCVTQACAHDVCVPASETGAVLSPVGWVPTASHTFGNSKPQNALDGAKGTDWTTGEVQQLDMWFVIDMGAPQAFFSIEIDCLNSPDDKAVALDVWLSNDGNFTTKTLKNVPGATAQVLDFPEVQVARYIKLSLAQGGDHWWRMDEIRVKQ